MRTMRWHLEGVEPRVTVGFGEVIHTASLNRVVRVGYQGIWQPEGQDARYCPHHDGHHKKSTALVCARDLAKKEAGR